MESRTTASRSFPRGGDITSQGFPGELKIFVYGRKILHLHKNHRLWTKELMPPRRTIFGVPPLLILGTYETNIPRIASYTGNRLIKVLVGQRRTGKSYLLRQIARHLVENGVRPRGLRAPATPAPPFFGSPKKGGKESSPLANVPGAFARDALRLPSAPARARALRESHAQIHAQKPRRPHAPARGTKCRAGPPAKTALPLELEVHA